MIPRRWLYVAVLLPPVLVSVLFKAFQEKQKPRMVPPEWEASIVIPDSLPKKSKLATMRWAPPPEIGEEAHRDFERDGFVVLRQAIDLAALEILRNTSENLCSALLEQKGWCHLKQTRWQVDEFRDFLLYGTLGGICNAFVKKGGVRMLQDGVFGMKYREPGADRIVSEQLHIDDNGIKGIYGDFHTSSSGVTVWMPMHDIDFSRDGGGVSLVPGFLRHECRSVRRYWTHFGNTTNRSEADCLEELEASLVHVGPMKQGDVLLWHPWVMHRTDPVRRRDFRRFAFFGWCIEAEAVSCRPDFCSSPGGAMPCCRDAAQQIGAKLDHPCWPKIYPSTPQHEIDAYFEQRPKPLIGKDRISSSMVPYSCET